MPEFVLLPPLELSSHPHAAPLVLNRGAFSPIFDPIRFEDEIIADFTGPKEAHATIILSGNLDIETYIRRLAATGSNVRRTLMAFQHETAAVRYGGTRANPNERIRSCSRTRRS